MQLNWNNVEPVAKNPGLPEVAVVGRSNVGKSSLLNFLFNRKGLVKTSNTPGKTRRMQMFNVDNKACLVDLPGYGYSERPLQSPEEYLTDSDRLKLVLLLLDSRHPIQKADFEFLAWAQEVDLPILRVLTKGDKLSKTKRPEGLVTSATKKLGRKELIYAIEERL